MWVQEFIPERLNNMMLKNLRPSMENFKNYGYSANSYIDDELYFDMHFWQCGLVDGSLGIPPQ